MIFKTGVVAWNLHFELDFIMRDGGLLDEVFREYAGRDCIITSVREGTHMKNSLHWKGRALDARANDLDEDVQHMIFHELQDRLGSSFDVVLHGVGANIHYHIEYDPS